MPVRRQKPPDVDALYDLEPVFEPANGADGRCASLQSRSVQCPYCGEAFETVVDLSSGSTSYIEDCQVCCRPIEFRLEVDDAAVLAVLETHRSD